MDILALAAAGAPIAEPEAAPEAAPGFDKALAKAEITGDGPPPPSGPPGPEPPPPPGKTPVAGEEVTKPEPNALSKKPDFLPLPEIDDANMPAPFWEAPATGVADQTTQGDTQAETQTDEPKDQQTVFQAMSQLVSQFFGGLFAAPQAVVPTTAPVMDKAVTAIDEATPATDSPKIDVHIDGLQMPTGVPNETPDATAPAIVPDPPPILAPGGDVPQLEPNCPAPETKPHCEIQPGLMPDGGDDVLGVKAIINDIPTLQAAPVQDVSTPVTAPAETKQASETVKTADEAPAARPVNQVDEAKPLFEKAPVQAAQASVDNAPQAAPTDEAKKEVATEVKRAEGPLRNKPEVDTDKTLTGPKTETAQATSTKNDAQSNANANSNSDKKEAKADTPAPVKKSEPVATTREVAAPVQEKAAPVVDAQAQTVVPVTTNQTTTKTADAAPLPPKEVDLVVKQVADRMQMLAAARPKNGVTIHLNPEDLGTVTVVVKAIGQQVSTDMFASDDRVRNALDQNQTRLSEAMSSRGFQLQSVTVSQQSNHSTYSQGQRDWQNQTSQDSQTSNQPGREGRQQGQNQAQSQHALQESGASNRWMRFTEGVDIAI